jgi:hypothetical protein
MCYWIFFNTACKQGYAKGSQSTIHAKLGKLSPKFQVFGVVESGLVVESGYCTMCIMDLKKQSTKPLCFRDCGLRSKMRSLPNPNVVQSISSIPDAPLSFFIVYSEHLILQSVQLQNPLLSLAGLVASIISISFDKSSKY